MSCRFPGAKNIDQFWENLTNGVESVTVFSDEDLTESGVQPVELNHSNYVKKGFVIEDEDKFDASFFGYSPKEAEIIDPQQRLFLELSWEVLENGGYASDRQNISIGVFGGSKISTYLTNILDTNMSSGTVSDLQHLIANDKDYLTSRVSFKLNLKGPSITVQSACSTSLVAIHLACDSLLSGACDMAIAGGASIIIPHKKGYLFQEGLMLSPDGRCRVFDAGANGMVPGNGAGVVLLKRLEEAVADHDHIYAVIAGSAVNNDGSDKVGYTAPSVEGQINVIQEAQTVARVETDSISYIEAHGTGTVLGDPIEIEAINEVFKTKNNGEKFCAIGSVKTNIGHLDTAAGIAGFIKTVLCLKHGYLVPSLNYEQPNPKIDFQNSPLYVNTRFLPWQANGYPRRAGVSSFGFGGTNAHVILEEAPDRSVTQAPDFPLHLLTLSAKTREALKQQVHNYSLFLDNNHDALIEDICFSANIGRFHFSHRAAFIAESTDDLRLKLSAALEEKSASTWFQDGAGNQTGPKVTFDISGQPFDHDQLAGIISGSHVLKTRYRLPVPRADRDGFHLLLSALGKLYEHGADIDWESFYHDSRPCRIPLPSYPFEKQRHWISSVASRPENIPRRALPPDDSDATAMWHAAVKEGD
ncbi:MAG: type I polyketide synthase, partial [Desulfobacterales bacterium]|nr:type I polyketide synthase [Desulfobacterales bacterium]